MSFAAGVWYGTLVILPLLPYTIRIIVRSEVNKVSICRALLHSVLNHCMWDISRKLSIRDKGRHILNTLNVLRQNCDRWSGELIYAKLMWFTSSQRISLWSFLICLRLYWCVRFSYFVGSYLWFVSTTLIAFYRRYEHLYSPRAEVTTIQYNTISLKTKSKIRTW